MVKNEIEKVKQQLIRRDEKIKSLHKRNTELERLLNNEDLTDISLKNYDKKTQSFENFRENSIPKLAFAVVSKVKLNSIYHKLFKTCVPCVNYFKDLIEKERYEEAVSRLCSFILELMKDFEKGNGREINVGFSDIQNSIGSYNGTMNQNSIIIDSKYPLFRRPDDLGSVEESVFTSQYQEKPDPLSLELKNQIEKSKQVVDSSKKVSALMKPQRSIEIAPQRPITVETAAKSETPKDRNVKTPRNVPTKVEIVTPGSRSSKFLQKKSNLKK
jgi:hypothetical protein